MPFGVKVLNIYICVYIFKYITKKLQFSEEFQSVTSMNCYF